MDIISVYDISKITSLTTDTCAVMRSVRAVLTKQRNLAHALFIPCDSHRLQLLIKDFLEQPNVAKIMKRAQSVVEYFQPAKKQYAIFREISKDKTSALPLSVITRWGARLGILISLSEPIFSHDVGY